MNKKMLSLDCVKAQRFFEKSSVGRSKVAQKEGRDYSPFGLELTNKQYTSGEEYRYGFNGKENDNDFGDGVQDYGMRIYDRKIVRFKSVDPLAPQYPELTPYQFGSNSPIYMIDVDGLEGTPYTTPPDIDENEYEKEKKWSKYSFKPPNYNIDWSDIKKEQEFNYQKNRFNKNIKEIEMFTRIFIPDAVKLEIAANVNNLKMGGAVVVDFNKKAVHIMPIVEYKSDWDQFEIEGSFGLGWYFENEDGYSFYDATGFDGKTGYQLGYIGVYGEAPLEDTVLGSEMPNTFFAGVSLHNKAEVKPQANIQLGVPAGFSVHYDKENLKFTSKFFKFEEPVENIQEQEEK